MSTLTIVMAQINPLVGDIDGNTDLIIESSHQAQALGADMVVFPELTLCGYPPEDLLLRPSMAHRIELALARLLAEPLSCAIVIGYPKYIDGCQYNMAGVLYQGALVAQYAKQHLPNYQVFDEKRYFTPGNTACTFDFKGLCIGLTVCEDIWHDSPMVQAKAAGAQLTLNINASPFHQGKQQQRIDLLARRAKDAQMPIVYVNQVGGQDELVFDGGSFAVNGDGTYAAQAPLYENGLYPVVVETSGLSPCIDRAANTMTPLVDNLAAVYQALVLGVRDYVNKNGFKGVVLGLSGGIDSALTLAVAVDALGADRVEAIMMPFRYTSQLSRDGAADQAARMGVDYSSIGIEPMYEAFMGALAGEFANTARDTTEENLQARCRGVILMAVSNKKGYLVLTTGNKSELAVGYSTLYGDMAGGFDVLKDVPKTLVFELSRYRNTHSEVIPVEVIERPPSAELAPDQVDEDSLPPYSELDRILERYVEQDCSANDIIAEGFAPEVVHRVIRLVDINEYKRRQSPVGVRISERGFGRDRRYPITNGWRPGH